MPRPKGSKNKTKLPSNVDYATLISEKETEKERIAAEIDSLIANINALKDEIKAKKSALKKVDKEIVKTEAKKAAADQAAAEEAAEQEAINIVKKALAEGTTADEIMELLS